VSFILFVVLVLMCTKLVGFHVVANTYGIFPIYSRCCHRCGKGLGLDEYSISLADFDVLKRGPKEVRKLSAPEIARLRSLLPKEKKGKDLVGRGTCSCEVGPKSVTTGGVERKIRVDSYCSCRKTKIISAFRGESWCCPFCRDIICGSACFLQHIKYNHDWGKFNDSYEWCPLCGEVLLRGAYDGKVSYEELRSYVQGDDSIGNSKLWKEMLEKYAIKNSLCSRCSRWDEKEVLKIPERLIWVVGEMKIYPLDGWVPPNVMQDTIRLYNLAPEKNLDDNGQFFVDLLKHQMFEEIKDSGLDNHSGDEYGLVWYYHVVWDRMLYTATYGEMRRLRTPEEMKETPIHGGKVLGIMRAEIGLLEEGLIETKIIPPLCNIVRGYLGWQLWNMERLLSRIHADVIRYAPSLATLLAVIGTRHLIWDGAISNFYRLKSG